MGADFFDQMVKFGAGPWIVPAIYHSSDNINNPSDPAYQSGSTYDPEWAEENLYISSQKLDALERAFKASKGRKGNELGFQMFVTSLTIMHEAAHYGFFKKNELKESKRVDKNGIEIGAEFEGRAYQRFSYTSKGDAMDEGAMRKYYNTNKSSTNMFGMSLLPSLYSHDLNIDYLFGFSIPSGGDPHIKPITPYKY